MPFGENSKSVQDTGGPGNIFESSESFVNFRQNGINPPSINSWSQVLFEVGAEEVEKRKGVLLAYAEATKNSSLKSALNRFDAEAAREVAKVGEDEAEERYKELIEEGRELSSNLVDYQEKLEYHRQRYKQDYGHDIYIDEFEGKIAESKNRLASIDSQLSLLEAIHYIPDEAQEERFR